MTPARRPVVLVTGASTGVGLCLVRRLQRTFYRVVATAREASLPRFAQAGIIEGPITMLLPLDVTNQEQRGRVIREVQQRWGGVDVLVNNAAISYRAVVEHMTYTEEQHQLATNYLAPMALVRLVLPWMRAQRAGRIINVSSVGGMMAMPTMASYSASKFALEGASEALWYELRPWNIQISVVEPGFIHSKAFEHVTYAVQAQACEVTHGPYCDYYDAMAPFIARLMRWSWSDADDVARVIVRTMERQHPPLRVPATLDAHLFFWMRRLLPRRLYHRLLYWGLPGASRWGRQD